MLRLEYVYVEPVQGEAKTSIEKALYIVKLGKHVLKLPDSIIPLSQSVSFSDCSQRATSSGHAGATARTRCVLRGPQVFGFLS